MSPLPQDRNVLSTFRMMFAYIGSFIALLLFMPVVGMFTKGNTSIEIQQNGWLMAVVVFAVTCTLLFLGCFALTKERVKPVKAERTPLKTDILDLLCNRPWWILLGAGIASLVFNSIRDGATVYYFKYFVDETAFGNITFLGIPFLLSGLYLAVGQASNIIGVVAAAPIANRIGKRQTFMWAMIIATVLSIVFYFIEREQLALIFILQVLISICAGSVFPLLWSMYADCADYSELTTGNRATGLIFSSSSMSQKFGWAIGTAITGWLLAAFGFQANAVQNADTIQGIRMFLSLLPALGSAISVVLIVFYPLTEKNMREVSNELEAMRKQ
jgi:GPH family glycoside/pentoside/hexuronide:cation symporter